MTYPASLTPGRPAPDMPHRFTCGCVTRVESSGIRPVGLCSLKSVTRRAYLATLDRRKPNVVKAKQTGAHLRRVPSLRFQAAQYNEH